MAEINNMIQTGVVGVIITLIGLIKIPKIEINFWNLLGRCIGKAINGEVLKKVDNLTNDLDDFKKVTELERVRQARQRILRFSDEILFEQRHSKEHFDEILEDIDLYEKYCREHEDYKNNRAELAIATIHEVYKKCLQSHDFLVHVKK